MKFCDEALIQPPEWYAREPAVQLAYKVLKFQHMDGGWDKRDEMDVDISDELDAKLAARQFENPSWSGFDDRTTWPEIRYLALVWNATDIVEFSMGAMRGFEYCLGAQFECGGWPQFFPFLNPHYTRDIAFHAQVTPELTKLMFDVAENSQMFSFVSPSVKKKAEKVAIKGLDLILRLQQIYKGRHSGWCEHYDPQTLQPKKGRDFEPIAIDSLESSRIIVWLKSRSEHLCRLAANHGKLWFKEFAIRGLKFIRRPYAAFIFDDNADRGWFRFYSLEKYIPIFGDSDGSETFAFGQISKERRRNFAWFGHWGEDALSNA